MGFQNQVNLTPAIAVAGDFASSNPRATFVGKEAGYVAGAGGITVGRFVWIQSDGVTLLNSGQGAPDGFVHREQQALISVYLAESSNVIPQGFPVTVMRTGDYYAKVLGAAASKGQKAFAKLLDGTVQTAAAGSTIAGASITASTATNVLTVTAVGSGSVDVGALLSGTSIPASTYITGQLTGTPGGIGTYSLSTTPGTVASEAMTTTDYVETPFIVEIGCLVNELAVISA